MDSQHFSSIRKRLQKTQKELAELLGTSLKAVCSYEQGWRSVPAHVERQLYFLVTRKEESHAPQKNCWEILNCPEEQKRRCPAWEFNSGKFCWFINGTICRCKSQKTWKEKIKICRECEVLKDIF